MAVPSLPPGSIYRRHILIPKPDGTYGKNPNFNQDSLTAEKCFTSTNDYEDITHGDVLSKYFFNYHINKV